MRQYFSKTKNQCSQAIKKAAKEVFENKMHRHDPIKTIAKDYLSNIECSVQEAVYHILLELKLRRVFPDIYFINSNLPEEGVQVLLSEKELRKLPDDCPNIFKKSNIDCYMERPSATFCDAKYSVLNYFCSEELLAYNTLENKSNRTCKYQQMK